MANSARNRAGVLLVVSILIIIFLIVVYYVLTENGQLRSPSLLKLNTSNITNNNCVKNNNNNKCKSNTTTYSKVASNDTRKQVYNISNNIFTYDEANAVCKAHGGKLATLEQMIEGHKKGADWCNYGWADGQMALYPTQRKSWAKLQDDPSRRDECGKPGVNGGYFRNSSFKFGANCYGVKPTPKDNEREKVTHYTLDPLQTKVDAYKERLNKFRVAPFSQDKWSQYQ